MAVGRADRPDIPTPPDSEDIDTIVVITADHGLAMGSHGLLGKQSVYEHSMGCPLIVAGPGVPSGSSEALTWLRTSPAARSSKQRLPSLISPRIDPAVDAGSPGSCPNPGATARPTSPSIPSPSSPAWPPS